MQGASSSDHQKMAKDWEREEEKAKAAYTESVRQDLSSKRIELWKALLKASTLQDTDILEIVKRRADAADKPYRGKPPRCTKRKIKSQNSMKTHSPRRRNPKRPSA